MSRPDIILIAAVGRQGQIGLNGQLPWHDPEDLRFFKRTTVGQTVIVGRRTFESMPTLTDRQIVLQGRDTSCEAILERYADKSELYIAGGAITYSRWLPYVKYCLISRIDYDGPADTFMPSLWQDHMPAIEENMKITEFLDAMIKRDIRVGNTHSAKLVGGIKNALVMVRNKKWPFLKVKQ